MTTSGTVTSRNGDIARLSERSPLRQLLAVATDWLLIFLAFAIWERFRPICALPLLILVIGNRQYALSILGHEAGHYLFAKRKRVNDFLGVTLVTSWLGLSLSAYRRFHFAHHKHVGTSCDPELRHMNAFAPEWTLPLTWRKLALLTLKDWFLLGGTHNFVWLLKLTAPRSSREALPILWSCAVHAALIHSGHGEITALWFASLVLGYWPMFRWRVWLEHRGTSSTQRVQLGFLFGKLIAPHNLWLHYEHHEYPQVPFHNLPKVRTLLGDAPAIITYSELVSSLGRQSAAPLNYVEGNARIEVLRRLEIVGDAMS
jgi:fatty acid desaturase